MSNNMRGATNPYIIVSDAFPVSDLSECCQNIIFLDIDGVLNSDVTFNYTPHIHMDKFCVKCLVEALEKIKDIKVVISSSWRCRDIERFIISLLNLKVYNIFLPILPFLHEDWATKKIWEGSSKTRRGREIREWLSRHPEVTRYLCIDDDTDFLKGQPLLQTDMQRGLGYLETNLILNFFNVWEQSGPEKTKQKCLEYQHNMIKYERRRLNRRKKLLKLIENS